jgi:DNA-binding NtrC family response regulator
MEKILLLDQDYYWRNWVKASLAFEGIAANIQEVADDQELLLELEKAPVSLVLVDLLSCEMGAVPLVHAVRDRAPLAKVMLFTGVTPQAIKPGNGAGSLDSAYLLAKEDIVRDIGPLVKDLLATEGR